MVESPSGQLLALQIMSSTSVITPSVLFISYILSFYWLIISIIWCPVSYSIICTCVILFIVLIPIFPFQTIEKFFRMKVPIPPYRPYAVQSFYNILKFSARVLRDCIKLMQLELVSEEKVVFSDFVIVLHPIQSVLHKFLLHRIPALSFSNK